MRAALIRLAYLLSLILLSPVALAEAYTGIVVGVADGDTITVLDEHKTQHRVRLMGIDAPEKKQAFGTVSRQHLASLVFKQLVVVETTKVDRYKRQIGKVKVGSTDVNLEQVKSGFAWHYKKYQREQTAMDRALYAEAEEAAQQKRVGLWSDKEPVAPWDFRRERR